MTEARQPILLGSDLREVRRLHASACSLVQNIAPPDSIQFDCPVDESPAMGQWLRVYSPQGDQGIYRITSTTANYGQDGGRCTVYAEHAVSTLGDGYIHTAQDIKSKTAAQALTIILNKQTVKRWKLGRCDVPTSNAYLLSYQLQKMTLLEAVVQLLNAYHGKYMLTYDFSTSPWTVNFVRTETEASCECRLSRNLQSAMIKVDRSQMANKLYCPDWKNDDGDTPSPPKSVKDDASIAAWGEVAAEYSDGSAADNKTVLANANAYLEQVKEPVISIQLDAYELSRETGVSMDAFGIGKLCRIALPLYDYTANERIIGVTYSDMYGDPGRVQLTLANKVESTSTGLAKLQQDASGSRGGRGGGGAAKKAEIADSKVTMAQKNISLIITEDGKVSKAAIVLALNDTTQQTSASITADVINLNGYVKASQLEAVDAKITNLVSGVTTVSQLKVSTMNIGGHAFSGAKLVRGVDGNSYWVLATSG